MLPKHGNSPIISGKWYYRGKNQKPFPILSNFFALQQVRITQLRKDCDHGLHGLHGWKCLYPCYPRHPRFIFWLRLPFWAFAWNSYWLRLGRAGLQQVRITQLRKDFYHGLHGLHG